MPVIFYVVGEGYSRGFLIMSVGFAQCLYLLQRTMDRGLSKPCLRSLFGSGCGASLLVAGLLTREGEDILIENARFPPLLDYREGTVWKSFYLHVCNQ